jgi:hypothetical protein
VRYGGVCDGEELVFSKDLLVQDVLSDVDDFDHFLDHLVVCVCFGEDFDIRNCALINLLVFLNFESHLFKFLGVHLEELLHAVGFLL